MGRQAPSKQFPRGGWKPASLPDLTGRVFAVTGGNSGIGFEASRMLGARGATVTILCRNTQKATQAVNDLRTKAPEGDYASVQMDLADLASVKRAAADMRAMHPRIDALVANAGIMMTPKRELTKDGFETQLGVNHLGHYALGGHLCDVVEASAGRFVSLASLAHKFARGFKFDDLMHERGYAPTKAYAQSKLANLVHAFELNRKLEAHGSQARAYACHPGYSATNLQSTGPGALMTALMKPMTAMMSQPAAKGAIPTVLCAAATDATPGGYYGPTGFQEMTGPVDRAAVSAAARDEKAAARLWEMSEQLTGVRWSVFN